jgi:flavin reductase (DIM6/NTAB) family NADH-FMN oxidoreductase RutF
MAYRHITEEQFENWERFYRASFFNSLGGFKSCNLIGSKSAQGLENLGLFFSVIHVGANPPLLGLLFRPHTVPRHTLENIRETEQFTINAVAENWHAKAHQAAANYPDTTSEFEAVGLTPQYLENYTAPFVEEAAIKYLCKPVEEHLVKANQTLFMVAAIKAVFIEENLIDKDGLVNHVKAKTVAVNALDTYYKAAEIAQWAYPRPNKSLEPK